MPDFRFVVLVVGLMSSSGAPGQNRPVSIPTIGNAVHDSIVQGCKSNDSAEVVVCGHSQQRYRIDPFVLEAAREVEALPATQPASGDVPQATCVGPECGGGMIPLVGMALTAAKAAILAANGDDWRDAFRTHPDEYRAYEDAKTKESKKGHLTIGVAGGN